MPPRLELEALRVAAGGDAVAHEPSGRVVFVDGALPGERVVARLTAERRDFARAVTETVLDASPSRVTPRCPFVAKGCGGCRWQHIEPTAQLALKREIVLEALTRTGRLVDPQVIPTEPLPQWGYRTTLRLLVARGRLAFRAQQSHDAVPVDDCLVAHPRLAELLAIARFPGAHEVTLRCSASSGERLALIDPGGAQQRAVLPDDVAVGGRAAFVERIEGVDLRVSARSFFQTRTDGAQALVRAVQAAAGDALADESTFVDAYAGVGLFAATLARHRPVVAIEQAASSCADAVHNLSTPRTAGDLEQSARVVRCPVEDWRPEPAGLVVADPARRGLARDAAHVLAATGAPRLVLVSCDPVALARDAALLRELGYDHAGSSLVDLFPHTPHVEVVTRFDRR
jgi:23S rRNA (uracil1939-C5)-methyltransferase